MIVDNKFIIKYANDYNGRKPVILYDDGKLKILIDTGADVNMYVGGITGLNRLDRRHISDKKYLLHGIENTGVECKICKTFLSIGGIRFDNIHLFVPTTPLRFKNFDIILGVHNFLNYILAENIGDRKVMIKPKSSNKYEDYILKLIKNGSNEELKELLDLPVNISEPSGNDIRDEDMLDVHKLFEDAWNKAGEDIDDLY